MKLSSSFQITPCVGAVLQLQSAQKLLGAHGWQIAELHYLESQVAQDNTQLCPKVAQN